jgi:hypothetical protein
MRPRLLIKRQQPEETKPTNQKKSTSPVSSKSADPKPVLPIEPKPTPKKKRAKTKGTNIAEGSDRIQRWYREVMAAPLDSVPPAMAEMRTCNPLTEEQFNRSDVYEVLSDYAKRMEKE